MKTQTNNRMEIAAQDRRNDTGTCTVNGAGDKLFESDWEVFVVKFDKATGKYVGRTACCATARVD